MLSCSMSLSGIKRCESTKETCSSGSTWAADFSSCFQPHK